MSANEIVFDAQYTSEQINNLKKAEELAGEAMNFLKKAHFHGSWRCPEHSNIDARLDNISSSLVKLDQGMSATSEALTKGMQRFSDLESRAETQTNSMSDNLKNKYGYEAANYGGGNSTLPVTQVPENDTSIVKLFLWQNKQIDKSGNASLGNEGFSYLESLYKFYTGDKRGFTGAEDFCDLSDKSISFGAELYEYLRDKDTFSTGLGIASNGFGLASDLFGVVDKMYSENLSFAGSAAEIISLGDGIIDIWGSIEKFEHVADTATNITTKAGTYSPLDLWTALGKTIVSTGSQAFKSIDKYSADGKWDTIDTARTGIESGVAGLYTMFDKLSLGGLSALGNVTGFKPENISRDIENWADSVGKRAGNYILDNPGLYNIYKSGPIGQTVATFHAAFHSIGEGIGNWFQSLFS